MWWPGTGLNRRRRPFQGRALPLSYLASVQTSELHWPARDPAMPEKGGKSTNSALQQPDQYTESDSSPPDRQTRVSGVLQAKHRIRLWANGPVVVQVDGMARQG
jgi:hypothetical protein